MKRYQKVLLASLIGLSFINYSCEKREKSNGNFIGKCYGICDTELGKRLQKPSKSCKESYCAFAEKCIDCYCPAREHRYKK